MRTNHKGFSVVEFMFVLLFLGVIGFVGYRVYASHSNKSLASTTSSTTTAATPTASSASTAHVSSAPTINKASDLTSAEQTLDQNDPSTTNSSDASQLDTNLSGLN